MAQQAPTLSTPIAGERFAWLDRLAAPLQRGGHAVFRSGEAGRIAKNWLEGVPIRHRVHPALVAVPIGAWTTAAFLDVLDGFSVGDTYRAAADAAILLGIVGAVPTVAAGLADWVDTYDQQRRVGLAHALVNSTALALYGASLALRAGGHRTAGRALGGLAFGTVSLGGALGGELVYTFGSGVTYLLYPKPPDTFVDILASDRLVEGLPQVVEDGRVPVLLLRREGQVYAVEAWCSHVGGPLIEGPFEGLTVECPWHQSCFRLDDGRPLNGPATAPLRTFAVRERDGRIAIRPNDAGKTWPPPPIAPSAAPQERLVKTTVKEATMTPGFSQDIRPLFRDTDVRSMIQAFDLSNYDSVKAHAEAIYGRVADGTMPCDGAWPQERIALLRAWIDQGYKP
jgi:nitrite reductase/ring-hydroxylating ferredoxin subunit/uncharacterized membrane protein